MRYSTKPTLPPNLCMECGEQCRRPKRFCDDACKDNYLRGREFVIDHRGTGQVAAERKRRGVTPEALENRRKLSVGRQF